MNRRQAVCNGLHAAALGWAWLWPTAGRAQGAEPVDEHKVKAAYLYKFPGFVEWPAAAFERADSPFFIGLAGADALADELEALVARRPINGRPVVTRRLRPGEPVNGLHLLFVGRDTGARGAEMVAASRRRPVLVVTETEQAFAAGAAINFVVVDRRVRFDVALHSAETHDLKISSRLLGVARRVLGAPP
ncbi:MAG: YfiR family protein [Rhizobacter sp.]|nr:YfiR family protein [Rhizobacter sp.]